MNNALSPTMRAVVLATFNGPASLSIEQRPVPQPGAGEVLLRVAASPINPSDLAFLQGWYVRKRLPVVPGFEASGMVAAVGEGVDADGWIGRRVAAFAGMGDGTWAEYMVTTAQSCLPIPDDMSDEQAAMLLVNPLTAWAMLDIARSRGAKAVVQTAAASALGRMIIRLGTRWGIETINIVRREEQVDDLRGIGAAHVLNSHSPTFDETFETLCKQLGARLAFDAVAGKMTARLMRGMPSRSTVIIYGGLAMEQGAFTPGDFIFKDMRIEGFWLTHWLRARKINEAWNDVCGGVNSEFHTHVRASYGLDEVQNALADYSSQMTGGKVLIKP